MGLIDWTRRECAAEIRIIMQAPLTDSACRVWARQFIQLYVPRWQPGVELSWDEAILVGEAFDEALRQARRKRRTYHR